MGNVDHEYQHKSTRVNTNQHQFDMKQHESDTSQNESSTQVNMSSTPVRQKSTLINSCPAPVVKNLEKYILRTSMFKY